MSSMLHDNINKVCRANIYLCNLHPLENQPFFQSTTTETQGAGASPTTKTQETHMGSAGEAAKTQETHGAD